MDTVLPSLFLQVILIASNAFFAMSEFAVVSVNTQKMKRLAEGGSKPAARLLVITEAPSDFLATIQVGVTLSGFLASAAAADSFADPLVSALSFIPIPASTLRGVTVFLITIILSYFMLIFGELAPKRIAMKNPDGVALKVVGVIWALNKVCKPVIKLIAASTNLVLRPLGIGPASDEEPVAEEDILMMVEAGEETGTVDEREHEMIKNIFEFDDRKVSEIMTHRTDVVGVPVTATLQDIVALQAENRFSRIPVYKEDLDDIVGAVFVKDLVPLLEPGRYADATPEKYMRSVLYVPEGMTCSNLLHAFQKARVHLAIVVDEYGGTAGMVTMEDLLETIVGDLDDEHEEDNAVVTLADGVYEVGGDVPVNELEGLLGEDIFENADCDTIGGFITETLGRIPQAGETLPLETLGYTLTVAEATPRAVTKVTITRTAEKTADPQPAPEQKRRFGRKKDRDGEK